MKLKTYFGNVSTDYEFFTFDKKEEAEVELSFAFGNESPVHVITPDGNAIEAFTVMANTMDDVEMLHSTINSIKDALEHEYPELKNADVISVY